MKIKIKRLINPISISVVVLIIIITLTLLILQGKKENYTNNLLGYSISYNASWRVSELLSKKVDSQYFLLSLYLKAGCTMSNFVNDESDKTKSQDCLKKSKNYKDLEPLYNEYLKNWNINNSQYVILTKVSKFSEEKLPISPFQSSINQQWPKGSFIIIHPLEFKLDFPQEDPSNSSGLSRTFYKVGDLRAYVTDIRDTNIESKDVTASIPYNTDKTVYSGQQIQSMVFSSTVEKKSGDDKSFFKVLKSFRLI